uniref:Serine/threonine-protein kinase TOR n=1 Tax=Chaetoceros debilis TaxID=122233 RepID=A0A7S3PVW7_9STRA
MRTFGILGALDPDHFSISDTARKGGGVGSGYFISTDEDHLDGNINRNATVGAISISKSFTNARRVEELSMAKSDGRSPLDRIDVSKILDEGVTNRSLVRNDKDDDDEPAHLYMYELYAMTAQPVSKISPPRRLTPSDEEFYPTVSLQALTSILKNPSLIVYHQIAMTAIMFIFNSLGLRCVPFLKGIVPHILHTARTCGQTTLREALLQQIAKLSGIVRDNLSTYVPEIFDVVEEVWDSKHLSTVLDLIEKIAAGVPASFREYVPIIITRFLTTFDDFHSGSWSNGRHVSGYQLDRLRLLLQSIRNLRENLVEYIHLLLPAILKLTDALVNASMHFDGNIEQCQNLTIDCSKTVTHLLQTKTPSALKGQAEQMPALVAQPLIRMIGAKSDASKRVGLALIEALCLCAKKIGKSRWIPLYHISASNSILLWHRRFNSDVPNSTDDALDPEKLSSKCPGLKMYTDLIQSFLSTEESLDEDIESEDTERTQIAGIETSMHHLGQDVLGPSVPHTNQSNKHKVNQMNLKRAWDVSQKTTREDWDEWMRRFAIQLLREAPAPALRATGELAYAYQPLARELFSAAFTCCWKELSDQYKDSLIQALKTAFFSDASPEILQTLLNLAEYAERDGIPGGLPIEIDVLAELALKCRSYAKALHYKEREHEMGGGGHCIEDLITINRKLDLPEAALGVLKAAQFELERNGVQSWDRLYYKSLKNKTRNAFSSRIFHRHQGQGLSFNVMATGSDTGAAKGGNWAGIEMQKSWLAKLGSWSDALAMYESKLEESPSDIEAVLGCMNCLNAQGEWRRVLELSNTSFEAFTSNEASIRDRRKAIKFCAQASWRLGKWDDFETFSSSLLESANDQTSSMGKSRADFDGCFYSAILNIHRKEWSVAETFIDEARKSMDSRFTALMAESRKRAYPSMVTAQTLAEMEEIIAFRKLKERSKADASMHRANKDDVEDARARLVLLWRKRLAGCRVDAEVHSSILAVRSLVLGPTDEVEATLALSALSRQAQAYKLSERVLLGPLEQLGADLNSTIFGYGLPDSLGLGLSQTRIKQSDLHSSRIDNLVSGEAADYFPPYYDIHNKYCDILVKSAGGLDRLQVQHKLYFAYIKHLWAMRNRDEATNRLAHLAGVVDLVAHYNGNEMSVLRVSCWLKLAEWKIASSHTSGLSLPESDQYEVLMALKRSTFENMDGYKSWHTWALVNFRLAQQHDENRHNILKDSSRHSTPRPMYNTKFSKTMRSHAVAAVQGFVKAICLGTKRWSASVQQDLLNYLTCLFRYVQLDEVGAIINAEINTVALEAWLGVLPQLLARIHMKAPSVRSVLHPLLIRLGKKHPQALMYPLSVLVKSPVIERKEAAEGLMNSLKKHSYALVEDALMVSSELIRVAILWLELWHEGLEDASRLYFGEGNVSGMLDVLLPLHVALERGPSTRREQDFHTTFGRDLAEAHAYVKEYVRLIKIGGGQIPTQGGFMQPNETDSTSIPHAGQNVDAEYAMNQAWDLYYTVFRKINKQLPGLTTLELSHCSPALLQAHNLELGVPGSYRVDGSFVKIERFYPSVQVITSKQRPRKIVLRGGDGKDYVFLLKGHEDLRQDERVMQLFGLVNALLARDRRTNNHDLNIQRYTITPLSHNAGVVGWVPHCDTLHSLIRDYRAQKRVTLNMENRQMLKLAQDYELLTVMQKVEIFSEALDRTTGKGNDIHEVLWIKSTNSEEWLDRRTKFTRSIAVMSMVGYILGLGDRHPSNLLLDQISGRVLHIDFGDCFEVAMHREKYPEKVPFRLTRMLIKAMEVSGIEGSYRDTCERTMGVLHDNRDTLVAMLEAFVYDPLISWRLLGQSGNENNQYTAATEQEVQSDLGIESTAMIPGNERLGRSMVHSRGMVNAPICEDSAEEGNGEERSNSNPFLPVQRNFSSGNPANPGSLHNSQMRSLKMYSEIQTLASNLNVSSRIASIAGDGTSSTVRNLSFAAESLSRSRLDRSVMQREVMGMSMAGDDTGSATEEALNEKALKVIRRVQDKLTGTDFHPPDEDVSAADPLDVEDQVQRLIVQATSTENLCQLFIGWCAFW